MLSITFIAIFLCLFQFFQRREISFTENTKLSFSLEISLLLKELCLFLMNRKNYFQYCSDKKDNTHAPVKRKVLGFCVIEIWGGCDFCHPHREAEAASLRERENATPGSGPLALEDTFLLFLCISLFSKLVGFFCSLQQNAKIILGQPKSSYCFFH